MNTKKILSRNATYQKFQVLKSNRNKRYRYNQFFVEGVRNINEAIKNKWNICSFLYSSNMKLSNWTKNILHSVKTEINYDLTPELLKELSNKADTSELLAIIKMREDDLDTLEICEKSIFILFDRPSNKGNLGTIIRSCDSFGIDGLILTGHGVDLYDPDVISASMGSFFNVPVIRLTQLNKLYNFIERIGGDYPNFTVVGTTSHNEKKLSDIKMEAPLMLMIGNETNGLCRAFKSICTMQVTIPMSSKSSASSLNVACAATVLMYEVRRRNLELTQTNLDFNNKTV